MYFSSLIGIDCHPYDHKRGYLLILVAEYPSTKQTTLKGIISSAQSHAKEHVIDIICLIKALMPSENQQVLRLLDFNYGTQRT